MQRTFRGERSTGGTIDTRLLCPPPWSVLWILGSSNVCAYSLDRPKPQLLSCSMVEVTHSAWQHFLSRMNSPTLDGLLLVLYVRVRFFLSCRTKHTYIGKMSTNKCTRGGSLAVWSFRSARSVHECRAGQVQCVSERDKSAVTKRLSDCRLCKLLPGAMGAIEESPWG
jgi:hypothetical protein